MAKKEKDAPAGETQAEWGERDAGAKGDLATGTPPAPPDEGADVPQPSTRRRLDFAALCEQYPKADLRALAESLSTGLGRYPETSRMLRGRPVVLHVRVTPDTVALLDDLVKAIWP